MFFFVLIGLLALAGFLATVILPFALTSGDDVNSGTERTVIAVVVGFFTVLVLGATTLLFAWEPVGAGHVGVSYDLGGQIVGTRAEGDKFQAPWNTTRTVSTQRQVYRPESRCSNGTERCLDTFSNDNQDVYVVPTLNYSIAPGVVEELLRNNPNYVDRSIVSRFNQIVKDETVKYDATELAQGREVIRAAVKARLVTELEPIGITVEDFLVDNIAFKPEFQAAIDAKVQAEQDALTAANRVAIADADALSKAATARGEADRLRIEAQGQADANTLLNASLTPQLIQFTAIQKLVDNIQIMLLPSDSNSLFDVSQLLPQGQQGQ